MLGIVGHAEGMHPNRRVNIQTAPGGYFRLALPHSRLQGIELAVDVGGTDRVPVNEGQLSYAGAGKSFGGIAAHAA